MKMDGEEKIEQNGREASKETAEGMAPGGNDGNSMRQMWKGNRRKPQLCTLGKYLL
jgi:hypothetical protein